MKVIYGIFIIIVLALWLFRGWSYYRYKRSGSILYISPFLNWSYALLWFAIGTLTISTELSHYRAGTNIGGSWPEELVFWVLIMSLSISGYTQRAKITQEGILHNGHFWPWGDIVSWEWDKKDCFALILNVEPKILFFKPSITIKLWSNMDHKDSLEQLLTKYLDADV